jgi:ParB-like chromosome segregation protein Spo0J
MGKRIIISGHQRVRACNELGIDKVSCKVKVYDSDDAILKDLLETNLRQRESAISIG